MPQGLNARSALTLLAALAVVAIILVVRDPRGAQDEPRGPSGGGNASDSPAVATTEEFCAAFDVVAQLHSARVSNDTPEAQSRVAEQGLVLLEIGRRLPVPREIGAGLEGFVQDLRLEPLTASPEEIGAFSSWLTASCER